VQHWILFEQADGSGLAVELFSDLTNRGKPKVFLGPFRQNQLSVKLKPKLNDDLNLSAKEAGEQGYRLLYQAGKILQSANCFFHFHPPEQPVIGRSADLLFALAVVTTILPAVAFASKKSIPLFPSFAATGVLDEEGNIMPVEGIPAKVTAAMDVLPSGSLIFFPKSNYKDVNNVLIKSAVKKGIELLPVSTLYDAVDKLGIRHNVWTKSPYLGLQSFEYQHRAIYFGRNAEIITLRECLLERESEGKPGVLVIGGSGSGKSSLIRAGLFPALEPQHQEQPDHTLKHNPVFWSVWHISKDKPMLNKDVQETIAWMPSLTEQDHTESGLVRSIQTHWSNAPQLNTLKHRQTNQLSVLSSMLEEHLPENRRFIWHIDQLEELFTLGFEEYVIRTFVTFLIQLQAIGVWLIVTLRNDFYKQYQKFFQQLFPHSNVHDLEKLDKIELEHIIIKPAERAKIKFQEDSNGISLAAIIKKDAFAGGQDVLPLLQFTLEKLYEKKDGFSPYNELKIDSYEKMQGLQGAISYSAEEIYQNLENAAKETLDRVLWDLAILSKSAATEEIQFTAQPSFLNNEFYSDGTPARNLVDRFCQARLMVIEKSPFTDIAWVRIVHEAVLNHWERGKSILTDLCPDMQIRDRLKIDAQRWLDHGCHSSLLIPSGLPLSDAKSLLLNRKEFLAKDIARYIDKSLKKHKKRKYIAAGIASLLFVLGFTVWLLIYQADRQAVASKYVEKSQALLDKHPEQAQILAIEAYRAYSSADTEYALRKAFLKQQMLQRTLWGHKLPFNHIDISANGRTLITSSLDGSVRFWDTKTGQNTGSLEGRIFDLGPKGKRIIVTSLLGDKTAYLWDITKNHEIVTLTGHTDGISTVAYNPDGRMVATGSRDESIRLWDVATGKEKNKLTGHTGDIKTLVFSPDGHTLASSSEYGAVRLWDVSTGLNFALLKGHQNSVENIVFSANGQMLATLCKDKRLRLWDVSAGRQITTFVSSMGVITAVAFTADNLRVAFADSHGEIRLMDIASRRQLSLLPGHSTSKPPSINDLVFSPDGKILASAGTDQTIRLWNINEGMQIALLEGHTDRVKNIVFSPDGHILFSSGFDGTARIWDMRIGQLVAVLGERKANGHISAISPNGRLLATVANNRRRDIQLIEINSGNIIASLPGHLKSITDLEWSPKGNILASASRDLTVRLWDVDNRKSIKVLQNSYPLTQLAFSQDGRLLATSGNPAQIWDLVSMQRIPLKGSSGLVYRVSFNPVKRIFATTGKAPYVCLWDADTGEQVAEFEADNGYNIYKSIISPNGQTLAATDKFGTVWLWDIETKQELAVLEIEAHSPYRGVIIAFSPDGQTLAVAEGNEVWLWDIETAKKIAFYKGHNARVNGIAFNADGSLLATASNDGTVRLWNTQNAHEITVYKVHGQKVKDVIFNPNSHSLITVTFNGTVGVWNCEVCRPPNELITAIENRVARKLTDEERHRLGLPDIEGNGSLNLSQF
jgi:WD40 repeat protein